MPQVNPEEVDGDVAYQMYAGGNYRQYPKSGKGALDQGLPGKLTIPSLLRATNPSRSGPITHCCNPNCNPAQCTIIHRNQLPHPSDLPFNQRHVDPLYLRTKTPNPKSLNRTFHPTRPCTVSRKAPNRVPTRGIVPSVKKKFQWTPYSVICSYVEFGESVSREVMSRFALSMRCRCRGMV